MTWSARSLFQQLRGSAFSTPDGCPVGAGGRGCGWVGAPQLGGGGGERGGESLAVVQVGVGEQPEVYPAAEGGGGEAEAMVGGYRNQRVDLVQCGAVDVQRDVG